jgi:RNA polymerase sigma-70 factor, ECF subfamily
VGQDAHHPPGDPLAAIDVGADVGADVAADDAVGNLSDADGVVGPVIPAEEAALVERAKAGDVNAFAELVRLSQAEVYTLAYRLTGNEDDARDVAQDAYLRAFRALKRFRGDARFSTWMYRITANCASTHLSRRSKAGHAELSDDDPMPDERPESNPEGMAEAGALRDRMTAALAELPAPLRAVVVLRDVYDLPHEAIASELGITEAAAKVRLHRARRKLRERLFPMPGEEKARAV